MTKDLLISQPRLGKNGSSILSILDALCDGMVNLVKIMFQP